MKSIFTSGDRVEIAKGWRHWKKGDKATVVKTESQYGDPGVFVILKADENKIAEKDCDMLYAYEVRLIDSSNADGNKKIPSIDWEGLEKDMENRGYYERRSFNWLKTNLQDYIK